MNSSPKGNRRSRRRWHVSTLLFAAVLAVMFTLANWRVGPGPFDVEELLVSFNSIWWDDLSGFPTSVRRHGWPWSYLVEYGDDELWSGWAAAANVAAGIALVVLGAGLYEWRRRRRRRITQITLADVGVLLFLASLPLAVWRWQESRRAAELAVLRELQNSGMSSGVETRPVGPAWLHRFAPEKVSAAFHTTVSLGLYDADENAILAAARLKNLELLAINRGMADAETWGELASLRRLQRLTLDGTNLDDRGLASISELRRLTYVSLSRTKVTDAGIAHLAALKDLQSLYLSGDDVSDAGVRELAACRNLEVLSLKGTKATDESLATIGHFRNLTHLDLRGTKITSAGLRNLYGLPRLHALWLSECNLKELTLKNLPSLSELRVPDELTAIDFENLPALESLLDNGWSSELEIGRPVFLHCGLGWFQKLPLEHVRLQNLPAFKTLNLDQSPLTTIALGELPALNSVSLRGVPLDKHDFLMLAEHSSIRELDLSHTRVDDETLRALGAALELEKIGLANTRVTNEGCRHLSGCRNLKSLDVSDTAVNEAGLESLPGLSHVAQLGLSGLKLQKLRLHDMPELETLSLEGTVVKELSLERLPKLSNVYTSGDMIEESPFASALNFPRIIDPFGEASERRRLSVDSVVVDDAPLLTSLDLQDSGVHEISITGVPSLVELNLRGTCLGDDDLRGVGKLAGITSLDLEETTISDSGLVHLAPLAPTLTRLNLTRTNATDQGLAQLRRFRSLELLYLGGAKVEGPGLAQLAGLRRLRKLSLGETAVTSDALAPLVRLGALEWLRLSHTRIDDRAADHLAQMPRLRTIFLNGTQITAEAHRRLQRPGREIDIDDTPAAVTVDSEE